MPKPPYTALMPLLTLALLPLPACGGGGSSAADAPAGEEDAGATPDAGDDAGDAGDQGEPPCEVAWVTTAPETGVAAEVFAYEASRPDATGDSAGADGSSVCSRAGVLPWTSITWDEAGAACASIGARLCEGAEWNNGCYGEGRTAFPYGDAYEAATCNTIESPDGCLSGECRLAPTGSYEGCASASGAFDMTGNASEWVGDQRNFGDEMYDIRGGHYASGDDATIRCRNAHFWRERSYADPMLGFRCCRDPQ